MSNTAFTDEILSGDDLVKDISEQLTEEKWTRTTIDNYSKRNFVLLDEVVEKSIKDGNDEQLRELCIEHLNQSPKSIIALYIAGIITYEQEIIDDNYIFQIINLFKENKKWQVIEYLAEKILSYGENKFALKSLEEVYENSDNKDELVNVWIRLAKVDYENGEIPKKLAVHFEEDENTKEAVFYYKMALKRFSKSKMLKLSEDMWVKLIQYIPEDIDFFFQIEAEIEKIEPLKASELLTHLIPFYEEKKEFDNVILIIKKILDSTPEDYEQRDKLLNAYKEKYGSHSKLDEYLEKSGLEDKSKNVKQAVESFEKIIVFDKGNFVYHRSWGIGKIIECKDNSFVIDFETKRNHTMSLKISLTSLKILPEDHIWIRKKRDPEFLKDDSPEGIKESLIAIFKSYGNQATMKEIKKEMTEIIPTTAWTKWWNKAKQVMKTSSLFGNSLTKRDLYFLRDKPLSFEEESFSIFSANTSFDGKLSVLNDYLKHSTDIEYEGFQHMLNFFVEIANNKAVIDDKNIKSFLVLRKIKRENLNVIYELKLNPVELMAVKESLIEVYSSLTDNEFRKDILDVIKKNDPEWENTFYTILKDTKATKSHNFIIDELIIHHKDQEIKEGLGKIIDTYRNNPDNYFWAAKTIISNPDLIEKVEIDKARLFFNLFHCLDMISKDVSTKKATLQKFNRKLFPQIVDFFIKEEAFDDYLDLMTESDARKIQALVNAFTILDEKSKSQFTVKLFDKFPNLLKEEVETTRELHPHLATRESYEKKQKELQHIINVEIPNNSKAIGVAQEKGDLRENADYIAALEHQKQLHKMHAVLTEEITRSKIIQIDDVDDKTISPGNIIHVKSVDSDESEMFILLGEWESDMENRIISYKSPFGKSLLGAKIGDTVVFDHGSVKKEYVVEKIDIATDYIK